MRYLSFLLIVLVAVPAVAQIPADVSMGFTFGNGCCTVGGEVTEHLNDRLAVVGGAYWGVDSHRDLHDLPKAWARASTIGFYFAPRLYTEPPGRLRPYGEVAIGFSHSSTPAYAVTFTPAWGVEAGMGQYTRFRTSTGFGFALGFGEGAGFNVTTALVLIPARGRR